MRLINVRNSFDSAWPSRLDLQRVFDRLFSETYDGGRTSEWEPSGFQPRFDLEETESHYIMKFDLPGVPQKDIQIEVTENTLTVSGERSYDEKTKHYSERSYGKFSRSLTLPASVDASKIEAFYQDGVLEVSLPKADSVKPRLVKISEGKGSFLGRLSGKQEEVKRSCK